jgi:hypothetical protein
MGRILNVWLLGDEMKGYCSLCRGATGAQIRPCEIDSWGIDDAGSEGFIAAACLMEIIAPC